VLNTRLWLQWSSILVQEVGRELGASAARL
jgi:hypothetical protein